MAFPLTDAEHADIKDRIEAQTELIVAAAVRVDGVVVLVERPGRHGDCINWLNSLGKPYDDQGFITNRGRFVDRRTAAEIVVASGQGSPRVWPGYDPVLFSEDMWNDWDVTPPARMTGFLATLTDTQKEEALSYSGPDMVGLVSDSMTQDENTS